MSKLDPEKLIADIIRFIETERELYGDFAIQRSTKTEISEQDSDQNSDQSVKPDAVEESSDHTYQSSNSTGDAIEKQEALFDENPNREIHQKIKECNTLDELEQLCRRADVLKTDLEGTNLVFGVGNSNADLVLIGEAPGADEDKQGEPFVGAAGQLLNKILEAVNFSRDDVYIANILKHRPPDNRNPNPEERKQSLPFLLRQIDIIKPKLILSLGKVSAQTLLDNDKTLGSMRGKFHSFRGEYQLMATYHPAALLRHAKWKRSTWEDVKLLRKRYDEIGCKP